MKTVTVITALTLGFLPAAALAEGKGNSDWAEEAAKKYEHKAAWAEKEGMPRAAAIYRRMAQIKRDAGAASNHGKKFDWSEYHELEGKLNHIKQEHHKHANKAHDKKPHDKERPGAGFMRAAEEYRMQAHKAREHGETDKARIFMQLAEHKMAAAKAARDGKGYDWTAYHELRKKLEGGHDKHEHKKDWAHKKPDDHKHLDHKAAGNGGKLNIE